MLSKMATILLRSNMEAESRRSEPTGMVGAPEKALGLY